MLHSDPNPKVHNTPELLLETDGWVDTWIPVAEKGREKQWEQLTFLLPPTPLLLMSCAVWDRLYYNPCAPKIIENSVQLDPQIPPYSRQNKKKQLSFLCWFEMKPLWNLPPRRPILRGHRQYTSGCHICGRDVDNSNQRYIVSAYDDLISEHK